MKYRNCKSKDSLAMVLRNHGEHAQLLGGRVPRLIVFWKEPAHDPGVVTEYVGEA